MKSNKIILRIISCTMLLIAAVYVSYALTHPEFGSVLSIGSIRINARAQRIFYIIYLAVTAACFSRSFVKRCSTK